MKFERTLHARGSALVTGVALLVVGALGVGFTTLGLHVAALMRDGLTSAPLAQAKSVDATAPELWFYCSTNLLVDENVAKFEALLARAGAAGA